MTCAVLSYALKLLVIYPLSDNLPLLFKSGFNQNIYQPWFSVLVFYLAMHIFIYILASK